MYFLKKLLCLCLFFTVLIGCVSAGSLAYADYQRDSAKGKIVYILNIDHEVSGTTERYVSRAVKNATQDNADYILIDLTASAEYDEFAEEIVEILRECEIPKICYVSGFVKVSSMAIAMECDVIVAFPGSVISAENKDGKGLSGENLKNWESYYDQLSKKRIEYNPRFNLTKINQYIENGLLAEADSEISSSSAVKNGLAKYEATSINVVLNDFGLDRGIVIEEEKSTYEKILDLLSSPVVTTALLLIGLISIAIEFFLGGGGVIGFCGSVCLLVYFLAGYGTESVPGYVVFFFFGSIALCLMEVFFYPGYGICGVIGTIGFFASVIMVAPSMAVANIQIISVIGMGMIFIMVGAKNEKNRNILKKLVLRDKTTTDEGYLSQPINIRNYIGCEGVALTALRPAGAVKIGSERVDVVTEGDFIQPGDSVKVIKVDGSSVIVRKL